MTNDQSVALYVHVPFCRARCAYCDFNTYAGLNDLIPAYVAAVCQEIEAAGERWGHLAAPTIYFGGGTPSLLPLDHLADILHVLRITFYVSRDAEVTLEANPGTVTPEYLRGLHELGVNRLSLGVQSAHEDELRLLGRVHTWHDAVEAVQWARAAGFANLNLDLIFGLPGQRLTHWQNTLEMALDLQPEHLSLYSLTVEEGTPLAQRIARGELPSPDDDLAAEMFELAEARLAEAGFEHYEISNWARGNDKFPMTNDQSMISNFQCRHNLAYWRNEPWLGFGAGAHSWLGGKRWANLRHPREYIAALEEGRSPVAEAEEVTQRTEMGETMMLGLRLSEGVSDARFRARFGVGLEEVFGAELAESRGLGLLEWDGHTARLTPRGRLLGNQVFARFV